MKKATLYLIFGLILILNRNTQGQGIYNFPDSLYHAGDFTNASIAYHKKIYEFSYDGNIDSVNNCYLKLSSLNFLQKKYSEAYDCLKKIPESEFGLKHDIAYKKAFYAYLSSDFASCEYEVELERNRNNSTIDKRLSYLEVLALNQMGNWKQAHAICEKELFSNWAGDSSRIKQCNAIYAATPRMKNAKKAEVLNFIIPGAGYFYIGKNRDGVISASLQLASLGLTTAFALQKLYLSGFFIGFGLYGKFKTGSTRRVVEMVKEINSNKTYVYNSKLREVLLNK